MRNAAGACAMLLLVPAAGPSALRAAAETVIIGDFESGLAAWSFSNGAEFPGAAGGLDRAYEAAASGRYGARLRFDFRGGGAYVALYYAFPAPVALAGFRFALRKPPEASVTVRVTDSTGQTVQKSCRYAHGEWQTLLVRLGGWSGHWGGANDGSIHQPVRGLGILIEGAGLAAPEGRVFVDDVVALTGAPLSSETGGAVETEYRVVDLRERGLPPSTTLLGEPRALRVLLKTDGSPGTLRIVCASHFQSFEKIVPLPETAPTGAIDVGMPPNDWRFFGGENDGRLHGPIRLTGLDVGGSARGRVELTEVRCRTRVTPSTALAVFPRVTVEADRARFNFALKNLLPTETAADGAVRVTAWDGTPLVTGRSILRVPGDDTLVYRDLESERFSLADHPFCQAQMRFRSRSAPDAGLPWQQVSIGAVRSPFPPGDDRLIPASPWGVGVYLYRYPGNEAGFARMERAAALARDAGVKWSREEFQWQRIEPRPGEFRWDFYDRMVETARRNGIQIYGLLAYWSPWARAYTAEGIEAYARWAAAVVRRYRDRIRHWEVWNEPNIFFWQGPRDLYAELLKKTYAAIKSVDPAVSVLGLSTAGIDTRFIRRMLELEAPFDILTIHPYRGVLAETAFMQELRDVKALVGGRPVWITEMGWPTQLGGTDEAAQARLLARTYLAAVSSGAIDNVSWYDFRDDGEDPLYNEHHFGVVRPDLTPKAAYLALATVCRTIADAPPQGPLPRGDARAADEGLFAYRFGTGANEVCAVWTAKGPRVVLLETDAPRVTVRNLMGEDTVRDTRERGVPLALVPETPVFVVAEQPIRSCRTVLSLDADGAVRAGAPVRLRWRLAAAGGDPFEIVDRAPGSDTAHRVGPGPGAGEILLPPADPANPEALLEIRRGEWRAVLPVPLAVVPAVLDV